MSFSSSYQGSTTLKGPSSYYEKLKELHPPTCWTCEFYEPSPHDDSVGVCTAIHHDIEMLDREFHVKRIRWSDRFWTFEHNEACTQYRLVSE